ncbi:Protoheme IX farnesyltransferase [Lacunisphaera limnophila]|uniref:Protoheme IX farnesyltransferase n=1 Tax=Lacunisphaera limnophila TaxID=1838286 RepID=A0A1I7PHG4_9BACT|nr:heme o synthase [Lacunisphaera limnophila]AOS43045.1 Protoheme IX farnesyltransferase [Lacunisphaera limnophila]
MTDTATPSLTEAPQATWRHYLELTKPRLSFMSVITAMVGYLAAVPYSYWDLKRTLLVVLGTALCAGGVAALNMWMEGDTDAKMQRTAGRPIPAGIIMPGSAFVVGWVLCIAGLAVLFKLVNGMSAFLALATIVAYLAIYTPAKRWSRWNTELGAISGALPPLIGWAAAGRSNPALGWTMFAILFTWQMPHFFALAWTYRKDYAAAGMPMLSVVDPSGRKVSRWTFIWTVLLVASSLMPTLLGYCTWYYGTAAALLGLWFLRAAFLFLDPAKRETLARRVFLISIAYLPLLLTALVADRMIFKL